jgi:formate-nitrite transporter family protein
MKLKQTAAESQLAAPVSELDHIRGPADASVTMVEYGDYECPWCAKVHPILAELRREEPRLLRIVFRHFPLSTIHAHASVAAQAAEAAAAQGKFWDMHDLLYERQDELAEGNFTRFAIRLKLETYKFESDLSSHRFAGRVQRDYESGVRSGVTRTPTLFINGRRYDGELRQENLLNAVRAASGGKTPAE